MNRAPWTEAERDLLRTRYATTRTAELAEQMGRSVRAIYTQVAELGIEKSRDFIAAEALRNVQRPDHAARLHQFPRGHAPWNKGKHYNSGGRSIETRFKAGRSPESARNYKPIGSLRITADGILERKTTDDPSIYPARRWVPVHRLVWMAANGPIPADCIVVFRPGRRSIDPDQITLADVELITKAENMRRNTVHNLPPQIKEVVDLKRNLVRRLNTLERKSA